MKTQDIALLRRTLTQHFSEDDHLLFVAACERSGLDPFARQIYAMHKEGKLVIEATIDGLRLSAERTEKYAGQLGPEWYGPDGVWLDIWTQEEPPTAARVGIKRTDFSDPVWGKALYSEYMQSGRFWRDMAANELAKCAEALGFRKAFPQKFSGLYTPEEMEMSSVASLLARPLTPKPVTVDLSTSIGLAIDRDAKAFQASNTQESGNFG